MVTLYTVLTRQVGGGVQKTLPSINPHASLAGVATPADGRRALTRRAQFSLQRLCRFEPCLPFFNEHSLQNSGCKCNSMTVVPQTLQKRRVRVNTAVLGASRSCSFLNNGESAVCIYNSAVV